MRIKDGEVKFHEAMHARRSRDDEFLKAQQTNQRLKLIPIAEKIVGRAISGRVADYGCGSGYLAAWLAKNRDVEKVCAIEITASAVNDLIPRMIERSGAPNDRIAPVMGDFATDFTAAPFDIAFCMGSLHHASDLLEALDGVYASLKPNGLLISQEPMSNDTVSNHAFSDKYSREEDIEGVGAARNDTRSDCFFRRCEFMTALHFAGFDVLCFKRIAWKYVEEDFELAIKKKQLYSGNEDSATPAEGDAMSFVQPHLIVAQKPENPRIPPHRWRLEGDQKKSQR